MARRPLGGPDPQRTRPPTRPAIRPRMEAVGWALLPVLRFACLDEENQTAKSGHATLDRNEMGLVTGEVA